MESVLGLLKLCWLLPQGCRNNQDCLLDEPGHHRVYSDWAAKEQWFDYLMGQEILLLPKATRLALRPIQPHIEWVMGIFPHYPPLPYPFYFNPFTAFCEEFYSHDEGSETLKNMGAYVPKDMVSNPI
jgi:hypothetical protein